MCHKLAQKASNFCKSQQITFSVQLSSLRKRERKDQKSKIGEVFFLSACYAKAAGEEMTLSCKLLAQLTEGNHTSAMAHMGFVEE